MDDKITIHNIRTKEIVLVGRFRKIKHKLRGEPVSEDTLMMIEHPAEWRWQRMDEARKKS